MYVDRVKLNFQTFRLVGIRLLLLLLVGILVFVLLVHRELQETVGLPALNGPFPVGRTSMEWHRPTPANKADAMPHAQDLIAWVWYPAKNPSAITQPAPYMPPAWGAALQQHESGWLDRSLTRDPALIQTHTYEVPALSSKDKTYPVVFLRAGLSAQILLYTSIAEALASHGYVVVGLDVPYRTRTVVFSDGAVIERLPSNDPERLRGNEFERVATKLTSEWTDDLRFAIIQLTRLNEDSSSPFVGKLDLGRLGVVGHSLGGAVAAEFCHVDPRCKIGIDLDGALHGMVGREGIGRPFMFILHDHDRDLDPESARIAAEIQRAAKSIPSDTATIATIPGANHFGFSDQGLLKSGVVMDLLHAFGIVRLTPEQQLVEANRLTLDTLDKWLAPANP